MEISRRGALALPVALACGVLGMTLQGVRPAAILGTAVFVGLCLWFVAHRRIRAHGLENDAARPV